MPFSKWNLYELAFSSCEKMLGLVTCPFCCSFLMRSPPLDPLRPSKTLGNVWGRAFNILRKKSKQDLKTGWPTSFIFQSVWHGFKSPYRDYKLWLVKNGDLSVTVSCDCKLLPVSAEVTGDSVIFAEGDRQDRVGDEDLGSAPPAFVALGKLLQKSRRRSVRPQVVHLILGLDLDRLCAVLKMNFIRMGD